MSVMHGHPKSVVVFLTDCKGRFNYPDGNGEDIEVKAGQTMFTEATEHLPENTSGQVVQVELKR